MEIVKALPIYQDLDVFEQGFPLPDNRDEELRNGDEEFVRRFNDDYYCSATDGFFGLAISPDTTRILAGNHDGEIYIIESSSLKILQTVREYPYYHPVSGCHYNPLYGHHEFSTCDEEGSVDIWKVEKLEDGKEKSKSLFKLKFEEGASCCRYSPDGQLIAVTSASVSRTFIISSHSGDTLYTLVHKKATPRNRFTLNSCLFFGHLCQVATVHLDQSLCVWKLPLVYSLKTLCLIMLRATLKYLHIDKLLLSTPVKLQLKYLYV